MRAVLFLPTGWGHISIIGIMRRSVGERKIRHGVKKQKIIFSICEMGYKRYTTIENHDKMTDEQKRKDGCFL